MSSMQEELLPPPSQGFVLFPLHLKVTVLAERTKRNCQAKEQKKKKERKNQEFFCFVVGFVRWDKMLWVLPLLSVFFSLSEELSRSTPDPWSHITIPFYIYEEILDVSESACKVQNKFWSKGADYHWLDQIKNHPWRRYDKNESLVFIIPANFDAIVNNWCEKKEVGKLLQTIIDTLEKSVAYQKYGGRDHLVLSTYYKVSQFFKKQKKLQEVLENVIWPDILDNTRKEGKHCQVSVMHNGPFPRPNHDKRNRTLFFVGQADQRKVYRYRVKAISRLKDVGENNVLLGTPCKDKMLPQCNHSGCCVPRVHLSDFLRLMRDSKWNLMIRGDNAGSGRLPEAIAMGVPNIIISPGVEHYLSFQCIVPWEKFAILTNPGIFMKHPETTIQDALSEYDSKWQEMKELQDLYSKHILWSHPESLVARNTLVDSVRRCFPGRVPKEIPSIPCPESFFSKLNISAGSFSDFSFLLFF